MKDVAYIVFEGEMARLERIIKRQFVLILVTVCLLVGTNAYWIWYESQFENVSTKVTQEITADDGSDATINDGVHINDGENQTDCNGDTTSSEKDR